MKLINWLLYQTEIFYVLFWLCSFFFLLPVVSESKISTTCISLTTLWRETTKHKTNTTATTAAPPAEEEKNGKKNETNHASSLSNLLTNSLRFVYISILQECKAAMIIRMWKKEQFWKNYNLLNEIIFKSTFRTLPLMILSFIRSHTFHVLNAIA